MPADRNVWRRPHVIVVLGAQMTTHRLAVAGILLAAWATVAAATRSQVNDTFVYFPQSDVLHLGDVFRTTSYPISDV
jgi:hypothetical protein